MGASAQKRETPRNGAALLRWARRFLPDYFTDEPARFHAELFGDLLAGGRRLARVAPRGHAKSTCAALAYPLWCICERRRRNIVIITHEASLATQFVCDIRAELESNDAIRASYGDLARSASPPEAARKSRRSARGAAGRARPKRMEPGAARSKNRWSQAKFTTTSGITVQAKGSGASLRGTRVGPYRPDLIICDDVEKDAHVWSGENRDRLEHWLRRVVMPALSPDGQLVVLGSILHFDSLLAKLANRAKFHGWDYRAYRAIEGVEENGAFYQVALWPARWPLERLDEERLRIGAVSFEHEYQANPVDDSIRVFRPDTLRRYDPRVLPGLRLTQIMAVDPSVGTRAGDFFALWAGGVDVETGIIYTLELTLERIRFSAQIERILDACRRWSAERIGIETVAYQAVLQDAVEEQLRKHGLYAPVIGLQTCGNKAARIQAAAIHFENGTFLLPPKLPPEIEAQFLLYPGGAHDDAPDVCALGIEVANSLHRQGPIETGTLPRRD